MPGYWTKPTGRYIFVPDNITTPGVKSQLLSDHSNQDLGPIISQKQLLSDARDHITPELSDEDEPIFDIIGRNHIYQTSILKFTPRHYRTKSLSVR